jgi:putative DNA primase/helicase
MNDHIEAFKRAIETAGLTPPDQFTGDGKFQRFSTNGKPGDDAGWYILHLDNIPAGWFRRLARRPHRNMVQHRAHAQTPEQKAQYATLLRSMQNAGTVPKKAEHDAAAEIAQTILETSTPIDDATAHGYLVKKGMQAHGARMIDTAVARTHCGRLSPALSGPLLVIPMRNAAGELRSLQFITAGGTKRPLTGGEKQGCHYLIKPDIAAAVSAEVSAI